MSWATTPCLSFDCETSGVRPFEDRIITMALVKLAPAVSKPRVQTWLANQGPDFEIPAEATAIHGITSEHARDHGQPIAQVLAEVTDQIAWALDRGIPVVAFNGSFDFTFLEAENTRAGVRTLVERLGPDGVRPVIDPYVLDGATFRKMNPAPTDENPRGRVCPCGCGAVDKTLVGACLHYGIALEDAHNAAADALAAGALWARILNKNPGRMGRFSLDELHRQQVAWRADQMAFLRKVKGQDGEDVSDIDGSWPLLSAPVAAAAAR